MTAVTAARTLAQFGVSPTASRSSSRDASPTPGLEKLRPKSGPIHDRPWAEAVGIPLFLAENKSGHRAEGPHPWVKGGRVPNNLAGRIQNHAFSKPNNSFSPTHFGDHGRSLAQRRQLEQREFERQSCE